MREKIDRTCWFSDAICPVCGGMMASNARASWCVSVNCGFVQDAEAREEQTKHKPMKKQRKGFKC